MPSNNLNLISQDCYIVNTTYMLCREFLCHCSCNIYACWPSVTVTNTAAVQTCLLVECYCKMDACWTVATQLACRLTFVTQNCMSAGAVLLYMLYLLIWCLTISRACWYSISLSAVPAGEVLHYRSCLLVWYLTISHACWCGASLKFMPSGVVPHCRSCLLVWYLTIGHTGVVPHLGHACWSVCTSTDILTS